MAETVNLTPILRAVQQLEGTINSVSRQVDQVGVEVGNARNDIRLTSDELAKLRRDFEAFINESARVAAVQRSETKVGNLKSELDRQYGHYSVVRRTSVGILQAFDVGIVSNDTVTSVSEELMLQTPRYWLAPALVALAAWSRDNEELSAKAIQEAFSRDKNKTSLFMSLVLRRQGRYEISVRWLRHYLSSLDPSALTREFAVVLEAAAYQAFGPSGQAVVSETMAKWCGELRTRDDIVEAQIQAWVGDIGVQRLKVDRSHYQTLVALSPEWPQLERQLERASASEQVRIKYERVKGSVVEMPTLLEDALDDLLDQLVTEYDEEELPLRREVLYHEAVIDENGDVERAEARANELNKAMEETTDVVSLQTSAAINPEQLGVSVQTQRVAIGVGVSDFRTAVGRYCASYRRDAVSRLQFIFSNTHSNYASTYGFQGLTVTSDQPEAQVIDQIRSVWEASMAKHIESISFKGKWYAVPALIVLGVALLCLFIFPPLALAAVLLGGAGVFGLGEQKKRRCAELVAEAERVKVQAIDHTVSLFRDANSELVDANLTYQELDSAEQELLQMIDTWPTASSQELVA